jgi:two-component system response regulator FixJ
MSHQRTVYVVDRDLGVRRVLTAILARIGAEAWPFAGGREFLDILDHLMPACVLLDMDLAAPGGLEVLAELGHRRPAWPVVAMSATPEVAVAVEAMKLGALDFLQKPVDGAGLTAALVPAWGRLERSLELNEARRAAQERLGRLTARELDIALALFRGQSNKTVAHLLGISVRTVEMHRAHIMAKLGVKTLAEAAVLATQAGMAPSHPAAPVAAAAAPPVFLRRRFASGSA